MVKAAAGGVIDDDLLDIVKGVDPFHCDIAYVRRIGVEDERMVNGPAGVRNGQIRGY